MNFKSITNTVVVLLVVIVISAVVIIPVVDVAQKDQVTEMNNTTQRYFVSSSVLSVEFGTEDGEATINGVKVSQITTNDNAYVLTDKFALRSQKFEDSWSAWIIIGIFDTTATTTKVVDVTVSIVDGSATVTKISDPSETYTCEVSMVMYPSATGDYGLFTVSNNAPLYVDAESDLYRIRVSTSIAYIQAGKMETLTAYFTYNEGTITTGETYTVPFVEHIEEYRSDYYKITESPGSFGAFVAPITYHIVTEDNDMTIAMLSIIPVLLLVVPIMIVVRSFGMGRD